MFVKITCPATGESYSGIDSIRYRTEGELWEIHPDWVSVKDRLPERNGDYLVCTVEGIVWIYFFDAEQGVWYDSSQYPTKRTTHWMPLPEPPKEGNNG